MKYLQTKYQISRRKFVELVNNKKVFLDGKIIENYKSEANSGQELKFEFEGKKFVGKIEEMEQKNEIVLFNKPVGFVVSKSDPHNKTIYDILPEKFRKFYYIGRLDKDSRGLVLLTNTPEIVNQYEHPSNEIEKMYLVKIQGKLRQEEIKTIMNGIKDEGEILNVKKLEILKNGDIKIILTEGKKRHIRRIFGSLRYRVLDLQRIQEGKFRLGDLGEGEFVINNL